MKRQVYGILLTHFLHGADDLLEKLIGSQLVKKLPALLEPEGSLPRLQVPGTCPYPQLDQSIPCLTIPHLEDPF